MTTGIDLFQILILDSGQVQLILSSASVGGALIHPLIFQKDVLWSDNLHFKTHFKSFRFQATKTLLSSKWTFSVFS